MNLFTVPKFQQLNHQAITARTDRAKVNIMEDTSENLRFSLAIFS